MIFAKAFLLLPESEQAEIETDHRLKQLDKDADGKLNYEEAKSDVSDPAVVDSDKDQIISREEFLTFLATNKQASREVNPNVEWAWKQIGKYDRNKDGKLTVDEWELMLVRPEGADLNNDGAITAEEYAASRGPNK